MCFSIRLIKKMKIKVSRKEFLVIYNALTCRENFLRFDLPRKPTEKEVRELNFLSSLHDKLMLMKINNYWRHRNED